MRALKRAYASYQNSGKCMPTNNSCNYKPVANNVLVGTTNGGITSVAPSTAGTVLTSNGTGSIPSFQSISSLPVTYTNVTNAMSPYSVLNTDYYISVDCSAGAVTLSFPNSPTANRTWIVKDRTGTASTNNITLTTPGVTVTFDGATSYIMNSNYGAIQLLANSTPSYELF